MNCIKTPHTKPSAQRKKKKKKKLTELNSIFENNNLTRMHALTSMVNMA